VLCFLLWEEWGFIFFMSDAFDPSLNYLYRRQSQLDAIFAPKVVAVIGATEAERSVGRTVMQNLARFAGTVYPINLKRDTVLGKKAYKRIGDVPERVDLAVIVTPAHIVPDVLKECAECKIPGVIIISAGFKEMGKEGEELELRLLPIARKGGMRIIGPNCLGVMRGDLNATFAADHALSGNLAFISQSGALCTAVLDWSLQTKVGFSAFVSIGSMVDVDFGDLIDYFGTDPQTHTILLYMESIGDARSFLSAAREVSLTKPIIIIKAGRSAESAKAAASHTGALSGSDEALSAALRRTGVMRVDTIAELFNMAEVLAKQKRPKGPHLTVITNAGGPGVIATDALIDAGATLTPLSTQVHDEINLFLPPHWSHNNPIDLLGDATPEAYRKAVEIVARDSTSDGVLVILTPQDMTDPTETAQQIASLNAFDKPLLTSWMGGGRVAPGIQILQKAKIPTFDYPDAACKAFGLMWHYSYNLRSIYEVPRGEPFDDRTEMRNQKSEEIISKARKEKRMILDEVESKQILQAYDIPVVPTEVAQSQKEAEILAERMGFPVVLKVYSHTITHKTDVGGVKLNLTNRDAVKKAFREIVDSVTERAGKEHLLGVTVQPMIRMEGLELIVGSSIDEQFGPVMLFGTGGQLVEIFKDRALAIPPLTTTLARRMMEQTKIYAALHGVRGKKPVDLQRLEEILVQFSIMILEQQWIKECDINPLLASPEGFLALDARVILHDAEMKLEDLPRSAIRPYPLQYVESFKLKNRKKGMLRPIRPEDEPLLLQFHKELSQETVRQRYLKMMHYTELVAHERLSRICFNDYDREIALVVETEGELVGVGRFSKIPGTRHALFALIVKDQWQNQGIGRRILQKIIMVARAERIEQLEARMLPENVQMQKLCTDFGFALQKAGPFIHAQLVI
jgi:acetyltransferase